MKTYQEICDDLVQLAVKYELASREHLNAFRECQRVRDEVKAASATSTALQFAAALEVASAMERKTRDMLTNAESAYRAAAKTVTEALEARSASAGVPGDRRREP